MALIMTVYNIKRAMNIVGIEKLIEKLKNWKPNYKKVTFFIKSNPFQTQISLIAEVKFGYYLNAA